MDEAQPGEDEGEIPICAPCRGQPSVADRLAHDVTHPPYGKWCEHCVRGRAACSNSNKGQGGLQRRHFATTHMGYAYVQEEIIEDEDELERTEIVQMSFTVMVMWESLRESVWAYAVRGKGHV